MRGGGTSQAGQAIGPGLQIDTSKYLNRILEVNAQERWARVEPGVVLDELNAHLRPYGLKFAPDVSTSNRATLGGMMANNSSGAHSLVYGKTIDHVLEQQVVLADGSVVYLRDLSKQGLDDICSGDDLESSVYRTVRKLAAEYAEEVETTVSQDPQKSWWVQSGRLYRPGKALQSVQAPGGIRGDIGYLRWKPKSGWCHCPKPRCCW